MAVVIVYSTVDGQTRRIAERMAGVIGSLGERCTVVDLGEAASIELDAFDTIVVGASIRYGKHRPAVLDFVKTHRRLLDARASAFFSVNIVARKPEKSRPETNPYVRKLLRQLAWQPRAVEVFAGRLDFPRYRWIDRTMIRFIMWLTGGPTAPDTVVEYTDWSRVDGFARTVAALQRPSG